MSLPITASKWNGMIYCTLVHTWMALEFLSSLEKSWTEHRMGGRVGSLHGWGADWQPYLGPGEWGSWSEATASPRREVRLTRCWRPSDADLSHAMRLPSPHSESFQRSLIKKKKGAGEAKAESKSYPNIARYGKTGNETSGWSESYHIRSLFSLYNSITFWIKKKQKLVQRHCERFWVDDRIFWW